MEVVALAEVAADVVAPTIEKLLRVGLDALWMLGRGVVLLRLERSVARFPLITVEPEVDADVVGMRATRSCRTRGLLMAPAAAGEGVLVVVELLSGRRVVASPADTAEDADVTGARARRALLD